MLRPQLAKAFRVGLWSPLRAYLGNFARAGNAQVLEREMRPVTPGGTDWLDICVIQPSQPEEVT